MKVTTDGCLFGAYASNWSMGHFVNRQLGKEGDPKFLDIGAGTGLLSLMMAQKNLGASFDAIEIDKIAARQALENFTASQWEKNLHIHPSSIQDFVGVHLNKYDLIISNPPFYEQQLKGENNLKNTAHHSAELTLDELFSCVEQSIKKDGYFLVLLPFYRTDEAIEIAIPHHLFLQEKVLVKQTPKHNYFRSILIFANIKTEAFKQETIIIKDEQNQYTSRFQDLLKDYYLEF